MCTGVFLMVTRKEEPEERIFWCQLHQLLKFIIIGIRSNVIFFNFLFRVFFVLYADRGLIVRGRPELLLYNQLYWTVLGAFFITGIILFPIIMIANGTFGDTILGKVCLLEPLNLREAFVAESRGRLITLANLAITEFYNQWLAWKVRRLLRGLCPNKRMSCIGNYRRNLMSLGENSRYLSLWNAFCFLDSFILLFLKLSPSAMFWTQNILSFIVLDVFQGLVIPLRMEVPQRTERKEAGIFYSRPLGVLLPRREVEQTQRWPLVQARGVGTGPHIVRYGVDTYMEEGTTTGEERAILREKEVKENKVDAALSREEANTSGEEWPVSRLERKGESSKEKRAITVYCSKCSGAPRRYSGHPAVKPSLSRVDCGTWDLSTKQYKPSDRSLFHNLVFQEN